MLRPPLSFKGVSIPGDTMPILQQLWPTVRVHGIASDTDPKTVTEIEPILRFHEQPAPFARGGRADRD